METFFKGIVRCPGCAKDTGIKVRAQKESTGTSDGEQPGYLHIPVENARCEYCGESFPVFFYEDGIELSFE